MNDYDDGEGNIGHYTADGDWIKTKTTFFTKKDVLNKYSAEALIEFIGISKVENILRAKKLSVIKKLSE